MLQQVFDIFRGHFGQGKPDNWIHAFSKPIHNEYMDKELFRETDASTINSCAVSP